MACTNWDIWATFNKGTVEKVKWTRLKENTVPARKRVFTKGSPWGRNEGSEEGRAHVKPRKVSSITVKNSGHRLAFLWSNYRFHFLLSILPLTRVCTCLVKPPWNQEVYWYQANGYVMVWWRMAPSGSCIWILSLHLVELFGKIKRCGLVRGGTSLGRASGFKD